MGLKSREAHDLIENPTAATPQQRRQLNEAKREVEDSYSGAYTEYQIESGGN